MQAPVNAHIDNLLANSKDIFYSDLFRQACLFAMPSMEYIENDDKKMWVQTRFTQLEIKADQTDFKLVPCSASINSFLKNSDGTVLINIDNVIEINNFKEEQFKVDNLRAINEQILLNPLETIFTPSRIGGSLSKPLNVESFYSVETFKEKMEAINSHYMQNSITNIFDENSGNINEILNKRVEPISIIKSEYIQSKLGLKKVEIAELLDLISYASQTQPEFIMVLSSREDVLKMAGIRQEVDHLPERYINYLMSAKEIQGVKYRYEFINEIFTQNNLAWREDFTKDELLKTRRVDHKIFEIITAGEKVDNENVRVLSNDIQDVIDSGKKVYGIVGDKLNLPKLSRNQYLNSITVDNVSKFSFNLPKYEKLAKLSFLDPSFTHFDGLSIFDRSFNSKYQNVLPGGYILDVQVSLINLASNVVKAIKAGDKSQEKDLKERWSWLSKKNGFVKLFEKTKYNVTYADYKKKLNDSLHACINKALTLHPEFENTWFVPPQTIKSELIVAWDKYGTEDPQDFMTLFSPEHGNVKERAELNAKLHLNAAKYNRLIASFRGTLDKSPWTGLLKEEFIQGDHAFTPVNSEFLLLEEGNELSNCCFDYEQKCKNGITDIISMRIAQTGERIATIEIQPDFTGKHTFRLAQALGYKNEELNAADQKAVNIFVAKLAAGMIPYNQELGISEGSFDIEELSIQQKIDRVDNISSYPTKSDAGYLAALMFERFTPSVNGLEQAILSKNKSIALLVKESPFYDNLEKIKLAAKNLGLSPLEYVAEQVRLDQPLFTNIENNPLNFKPIIIDDQEVVPPKNTSNSGMNRKC